MTSNERIVELMSRYVLAPDEEIVRVRDWSDGIAVTSARRHFVVGSESSEWAIGREPWVDDVVIATRDDVLVDGQQERYGFLIHADGRAIYLNDRVAVADLGGRCAAGMDPIAFAEILVEFHPYSAAWRRVIVEPDGLQRTFAQRDLPPVEPVRLLKSPLGAVMTFSSFARHRRADGTAELDILRWTVEIPPEQPARWKCVPYISQLELEPQGVNRV